MTVQYKVKCNPFGSGGREFGDKEEQQECRHLKMSETENTRSIGTT